MKINIVADNPDSWIIPYAKKLKKILAEKHQVRIAAKHKDIKQGDCAVFLGCEQIVKSETLKLNKYNLVVHESKLPRGKGMSPLTWQILEGRNKIPITLFGATNKVDSGDIYLQDFMHFRGDELVDELRQQQGGKTVELIVKFINSYKKIKSRKQKGKSTFYPRRAPQDSELNINKTIKSQFNLLRVVDNKRYPAFFRYKGEKYFLNIYKDNNKA